MKKIIIVLSLIISIISGVYMINIIAKKKVFKDIDLKFYSIYYQLYREKMRKKDEKTTRKYILLNREGECDV